QAFGELINRYPVGKLPQAGGLNATLVVTMTLDSLMGGLKAAQLDTGQTISASLARRMACEAGIIPAVLGGKSEVLDLGRSRRFHSRAQRIAKLLTAGGCQVDGCDAPPGLTHLHHKIKWSLGGRTDLDITIMICAPHHARAHDPTYTLTPIPGDKFTFHRRT
ncbi:HNH endonuclease signature motif containing protein, partial [uncultured Nocardioides sp.]|uniref:HNH endonuclease signature motif containing protein n=1 Tax=uncultured Nocardioides sp. TaxID=198441 RepID=UPI002602309C